MRFSVLTVLAGAATAAMASSSREKQARKNIGTFDTFTDEGCSEGGMGVDVTGEEEGYTDFGPGIKSIKSYLPENCALVVWVDGTTQPPLLVVHPGRVNECIPLPVPSERLFWNAVCE